MRNLLLAALHLAVVTAKVCGAGGVRAVMAEDLLLKQQLIVLVMDQCTRRLVGIGVQCGTVTGADVCRMFNAAIHGQGIP